MVTEPGLYQLLVQGIGDNVGDYSFRLLDAATTSVAPGAPISGTFAANGAQLFHVAGLRGQRLVFDSTTGGGTSATWRLSSPGGQQLFSTSIQTDQTVTLPVDGDYTLQLTNNGATSTPYSFQLHDLSDAPVGNSGFGVLTSGTITAGETDTYNFTGDAGTFVWLDSRGTPASQLNAVLRDPANQVVFSSANMDDQGPVLLPRSGNYILSIEGDTAGSTGAYEFRLVDLSAQSTLVAPGDPVAGNINPVGEADFYRVPLTAGQRVVVDTQLSGPELRYHLIQPSGGFLVNNGDARFDTNTLVPAETGTYFLVVFGSGAQTGAYDLRFQVAALTVSPSALDMSMTGAISTPGEADVFTFVASAGQRVLFDSQLGTPQMFYTLLSPMGRVMINQGDTRFDSDAFFLEETGTYQVVVFQFGDRTGAYDFRIGSSSVTTTASALDAPMAGTLSVPGEMDVFTFAANAGQRVLFDSQLGTPQLFYRLLSPTGRVVINNGDTRFDSDAFFLEETGTYQVVVLQFGDRTGAYSFRIGSSSVTTTASALDAPMAGALMAPGETDVFTFTANVGQRVLFDSRLGTPQIFYKLLSPTGRVVINSSDARFDSNAFFLEETGTFQVVVFQSGDRTGAYDFRIGGSTVTKTVAGLDVPLTGAISAPGEVDLWTFSGEAGGRVLVDSRRSSPELRYHVLSPTRRLLVNTGDSRFDSSILSLPESGEYQVIVFQNGDRTGDYDLRVVDVSTPTDLPFSFPVAGSLDPGRGMAAFRFYGDADQRFHFNNLGSPGAGRWTIVDGGNQTLSNVALSQDFVFTAPTSGVFTLLLIGESDTPVNYLFQAAAPLGATAPLVLDAVTTGQLGAPGEQDRFTFNGTVGTRLLFDAQQNDLANLTFRIVSPSGATVLQKNTDDEAYPTFSLTETGEFRLIVESSTGVTGDYRFRLLDANAAPAITLGTPVVGTLTPGLETDILRLNGTAGQRVRFDFTTTGAYAWELHGPADTCVVCGVAPGTNLQAFLPSTGAYSVVLRGTNAAAASVNYALTVTDVSDAPVAASGFGVAHTGTVSGAPQNFIYAASAGTQVYLDMLGASVASVTYELRDPTNQVVFSGTNASDVGPSMLTRSGSYTLRVSGTGNYGFRLSSVAEATPLVLDRLVNASLTTAFESDLYRLQGVAGQRVYLDLAGDQVGGDIRSSLFSPDGVKLFDVTTNVGAGPVTLPRTGTYLLVIGRQADTGSYAFRLMDVIAQPELKPSVVMLGAITGGNQADVYRINATAGQALSFDVTASTFGSRVRLYSPANVLLSNVVIGPDFSHLPQVTGEYVLVIDGASPATESYSLELGIGGATNTTPIAPLTSVSPAGGGALRFTYGAFNQPTSMIDELGRQTLYAVDGATGNRLSETRVIGAVGGGDDLVTTYAYTADKRLDTIVNPLGRITDYDYDAQQRLVTVTYAKGTADEAQIHYEYDVAGNVIVFIDELGRRTEYQYDTVNRLTRITEADPDGAGPLVSPVWSFTYDAVGNLLTATDPRGGVTSNQYDALNRLTRMVDALGHATRYEYDARGNQTATVDALGRRTQYDYDARDRLVDMTDALGQHTTLGYDNGDNLTTIVDALGATTSYAYDARSRLVSVTDALGSSQLWQYDAVDNVVRITDEAGRESRLRYDDVDRLLEAFDPLGARTQLAYDKASNLVSTTDPLGRVTQYAYNARDWNTSRTDALGGVSSSSYDDVGNVVVTTDELGHATQYAYDALDRLVTSTDPLGGIRRLAYDNSGNVTSTTDELGHVTQYFYDAIDRMIRTRDPDSGDTTFAYDAVGNLAELTDPVGNSTTYAYDALDRVVRETNELGAARMYAYDAVGNRIQQTDRNGRVTQYAYDPLWRVTSETWIGGGNTVQWAYDAVGNVLAATDAFSSLTMTYDARDQMLSVDNAGTPGAPHVELAYAYDLVGNRMSLTDTIDGAAGGVNAYAFDALNRVTLITQSGADVNDKRVDFAYNALGQCTELQRFADLSGTQLVARSNYTYDALKRLTGLHHRNAANVDLAFFDYQYDAQSRITRITDIDGVTDYSYDDRDQLVGADHSAAGLSDETYTYDANGNRVSSGLHGNGYVTGLNNQLLSDGTYNYAYDGEGNLVRRTSIATGAYREFTWDYRNRLIAVVDKTVANVETQRVEVRYDALNRRIAKAVDTAPLDAVDAVVEHYLYDGQDVLLDFLDADGSGAAVSTLSQRYLHGPAIDQVLAQDDEAAGVHWHLSDHLGTIRDLVSDTGAVVTHLMYDSYGTVIVDTNPSVNTRFRFTGREFDAESGLHYYRARYFDSTTGQFISEDPIGFVGGQTDLYGYVGNAPNRFSDPSGLIPWREGWKELMNVAKDKGKNYLSDEAKQWLNKNTEQSLQNELDRTDRHLQKLSEKRDKLEEELKTCKNKNRRKEIDRQLKNLQNDIKSANNKRGERVGELQRFREINEVLDRWTDDPFTGAMKDMQKAAKWGEGLAKQHN